MKDYYQILGVSKTATATEIKRVFRDLAKKYHPDATGNEQHQSKFQEITEAYEVLSHPERRKQYDQKYFGGRNYSGFHAPKYAQGFEIHSFIEESFVVYEQFFTLNIQLNTKAKKLITQNNYAFVCYDDAQRVLYKNEDGGYVTEFKISLKPVEVGRLELPRFEVVIKPGLHARVPSKVIPVHYKTPKKPKKFRSGLFLIGIFSLAVILAFWFEKLAEKQRKEKEKQQQEEWLHREEIEAKEKKDEVYAAFQQDFPSLNDTAYPIENLPESAIFPVFQSDTDSLVWMKSKELLPRYHYYIKTRTTAGQLSYGAIVGYQYHEEPPQVSFIYEPKEPFELIELKDHQFIILKFHEGELYLFKLRYDYVNKTLVEVLWKGY